MVEVRFRTAADKALWCDSTKATALFGPHVSRLVSLCLQRIAALDSVEDIVLLPRTSARRGERWALDLNGAATVIVSAAGTDVVAGTRRTVSVIAVESIEVLATP